MAMGCAGWSLALELLLRFYEDGQFSSLEVLDIIDSSIVGIRELEKIAPHPAFRVAVEALEGHLDVWRKGRPGRD